MRAFANRGIAIARCGAAALLLLSLCADAAAARERRSSSRPAAAAVVRLVSGGAAIPTVRTARGVTTMLTLPEEAREAICGDLYDAQSGNGNFVIQRSGRDLFLKPLKSSEGTNLFVKTECATYAFELEVVQPALAMRIVRVDVSPESPAIAGVRERLVRDRRALDAERRAFERERADAESDISRRRDALDRDAAARAEALAREWLAASVRSGSGLLVTARPDGRSRSLDVTLGDAALIAGGRTYLVCTVRNRGAEPVTVATAELGNARATLDEVVPPGLASTLVLTLEGRAGRADALRLLDPAGRTLVSMKPFR